MAMVPLAAAGAGAGAATGGLSSALLKIGLPVLISLLQRSGLFGKTQEQKQREMFEELLSVIRPQQQYYGGLVSGIEPSIRESLLSRMNFYKGWGYPTTGGGG